MIRSHDKARLDALLEEFKAQCVGYGYIDIIVTRANCKDFAKALIEDGFMIQAISWWEYIEDTHTLATYGMGGPTSKFYEGWFAETCGEIDDVPHIDNPDQALLEVLEIVESKVICYYDGIQIAYKDTLSLTPAFWLDVDESWRNTQNEEA